jgi:hypothetical protein
MTKQAGITRHSESADQSEGKNSEYDHSTKNPPSILSLARRKEGDLAI